MPGHVLTTEDRRKGATISNAMRRSRHAKVCATAADAYDLVDAVGREGVTVQSVVATLVLSDMLITNEVPPPSSAAELESVAKALKIAHTIMRLEHNESTSNAAVSALTTEERATRRAELQRRIAELGDDTLPAT